MTNRLSAGEVFPKVEVSALDSSVKELGATNNSGAWKLVVVYRGLHCPICKKYITRLNELADELHQNNIEVCAVSTDPQHKAAEFARELSLSIPITYGLTIEQARGLGLYISEPRSEQETEAPFSEPGLFLIRPDGRIQIVDISNAPFSRPDLNSLLSGILFIQKNDYPIRGTL